MRKGIILAALSFLTAAQHLTEAQGQEMTVTDIQNSGCLNRTRGGEDPIQTIVLTKEGRNLSVQLLNYKANCCTSGFLVQSSLSDAKSAQPTLSVQAFPEVGACDCECPYNVTFTVRDFVNNSFYLSCWWFYGLVELRDGEPLTLENIEEDAYVGGMKYTLHKTMHIAMLNGGTNKGELVIPSELSYANQKYTVTSISQSAFRNNTTLTKITIPKTVRNTYLSYRVGFVSNPFFGCTGMKQFVVEEGNPAVSSIDGVLFNQDATMLICYPADASRTSYIVPESVSMIEGCAFNGSKLKTLCIKGIIEPRYMNRNLFYGMGTDTKLYVQSTEVEKYKAIYGGEVYPLSALPDGISEQTLLPAPSPDIHDLQGRRVSGQPRPGIYIGAGDKRKVLKK